MTLKDRVLKMEDSGLSQTEAKESIQIIEKLCDELIKNVEKRIKNGDFRRWTERRFIISHTYCAHYVNVDFLVFSGNGLVKYNISQFNSWDSTSVEIKVNRKLLPYRIPYVETVTDYLKKEGFCIIEKERDKFRNRVSIEFMLKWEEKQ